MFDLLIRNAKVIDGTGSPWYRADIGILGDRIAKVGNLSKAAGKQEINAQGRIVSPGFIDMHTHSDLYVLEQGFIAAKIRQGITTDLLGQDGIAAAPLPPEYVNAWQKNLAGLDGTPNIEWDWTDVDSYLKKIEKVGPGYNLAFLVPHGNIRMQVMGLEGRAATSDEIMKMQAVLRESLSQGACGMSSGLIYPPCVYAELGEIEALCEVLAEYGAPFVVHQRSEGDDILESMEELIGIARNTGVHLHFSHFKICGKLGVSGIYVKDESCRFGLNAFKVLGGSYAIGRYLAKRLDMNIEELSFDILRSRKIREKTGTITFTTATDGIQPGGCLGCPTTGAQSGGFHAEGFFPDSACKHSSNRRRRIYYRFKL